MKLPGGFAPAELAAISGPVAREMGICSFASRAMEVRFWRNADRYSETPYANSLDHRSEQNARAIASARALRSASTESVFSISAQA